ncbi:MAG: 4-(cytidine 5'-diphospho)-2-C-methyl-D-erythritol kinase [Clostridia bacterium]|nr:4-(cytidine 5'-diphospho)-2-C-methyl-D-erythritol kinase [Clostridia bacterium]
MKVKVAAKINLMLDILKKLPNGYHSLFMIMQSVDLYDTITVEKNNENKIVIKCDTDGVPCNEKNIAYKCAKAFFNACNIEEQGITIEIEKNIPMAAGTAGGSADGAGVLYCLNKIYDTNFTQKELCEIGSKVGADIPFSLTGGTAITLNTGDIIAPVKDLPECYIVLCKPDQDVSTPEAYAQFDALSRVRHLDRVSMIEAVANADYEKICAYCGNVFEQAVEVPKRPHIKGVMRKCGADACCMSGSGPTVFGLFSNKEKAEDCYNKLTKKYNSVYLCKPTNKGIIEL